MKRSICSNWTLPFKIFNLLMWTLPLAGLILALVQAAALTLPDLALDLILVAAFSGFFLLVNHRLKFVAVDEQNLYAARWFKEKAIPLSQIESVRLTTIGFIWVCVRFKTETEFGRTIYFIPTFNKVYILSWWRNHPILEELRNLAKMNS